MSSKISWKRVVIVDTPLSNTNVLLVPMVVDELPTVFNNWRLCGSALKICSNREAALSWKSCNCTFSTGERLSPSMKGKRLQINTIFIKIGSIHCSEIDRSRRSRIVLAREEYSGFLYLLQNIMYRRFRRFYKMNIYLFSSYTRRSTIYVLTNKKHPLSSSWNRISKRVRIEMQVVRNILMYNVQKV